VEQLANDACAVFAHVPLLFPVVVGRARPGDPTPPAEAMPDHLRSIIDVLVDIDDPAAGAELARRAHLSRFHFDRVTAAVLGESPGVFRRRLLLERAAYGLTRGTSVTTRRSAPVTRR